MASIAAIIDPEISKDSLLHFLWHDIHEGQTGDIPYYSKLRWPGLKEVLTKAEQELNDEFNVLPNLYIPEDKITLKIAEYFDVLIFTCKETYLGNKEFKTTIRECVELIIKLYAKYPQSKYFTDVQQRINELLTQILIEYTNKTDDKFYSQWEESEDVTSNSGYGDGTYMDIAQ